MFEAKLNCDAKTDHLFPKSVLPLFDTLIENTFKDFLKVSMLFL